MFGGGGCKSWGWKVEFEKIEDDKEKDIRSILNL